MNQKLVRALAGGVLALTAGSLGYTAGGSGANTSSTSVCPNIPAQTVEAPAPGKIRVIYSLDQKQNDKELIALIDGAQDYIYFAIYTFTLSGVADALVDAKGRGVRVYGIVDSGQAATSYSKPIIAKLVAAGIPVVTEKHPTGNGIMHIKALVTERAYAIGSYNWTSSATTINDEILEIGTDPSLRQTYEDLLKRLFGTYKGNAAASAAAPVSIGTISYTDAGKHIGETASVQGKLMKVHTSASGTTFLDFCANYKTCPFTAVIFSDDTKAFGDLGKYVGREVTLTGKISSYQGKAEIILSTPSQLSL